MKRIRVVIMSLCVIWCIGWSLNIMAAKYDPLVENAQKRLTELGYEVGTADGKMGPKTVEAIKKFQQDQGLTVTGKLDEETRQKLDVLDKKQSTEGAPDTQKRSGASAPQEKDAGQTPKSESIPGITVPLTVEGVEFQLTSATLEEVYESGGQEYKPTSATDIFLIVKMKVNQSTEEAMKTFNQNVVVHDENGRKNGPGITQIQFKDGQVKEGAWVFVIAKSSRAFTVELPGEHKIRLETLLKEENPK